MKLLIPPALILLVALQFVAVVATLNQPPVVTLAAVAFTAAAWFVIVVALIAFAVRAIKV